MPPASVISAGVPESRASESDSVPDSCAAAGLPAKADEHRHQRHECGGAGGAPDFEQEIVRILDLFARLGQLVLHVGVLEVARPTAEPGTLADHGQGRLPVFEPIAERLAGLGKYFAIEAADGHRSADEQRDDDARRPGQPPGDARANGRQGDRQSREPDRRADPGAAALGQYQAAGDRDQRQGEDRHAPAGGAAGSAVGPRSRVGIAPCAAHIAAAMPTAISSQASR